MLNDRSFDRTQIGIVDGSHVADQLLEVGHRERRARDGRDLRHRHAAALDHESGPFLPHTIHETAEVFRRLRRWYPDGRMGTRAKRTLAHNPYFTEVAESTSNRAWVRSLLDFHQLDVEYE